MLELRNICKTFGTVCIFDNFNLKINKGDFISVIGSNGAGKSTLLNILAGTISPDSGKILLNGIDITSQKEHERAKYMGRVFQNPAMGTCGDMTVRRNLAIANKGAKPLARVVHKKDDNRKKELLSSFGMGLENLLSRRAGALSGGQRQAISLLMATVSHPELLLLDEHTAALDPAASKLVMEKTKQLVEQNCTTTIMITHNLKWAIEYGTRLIALNEGGVVLDAEGEDKNHLTKNDLLHVFGEV